MFHNIYYLSNVGYRLCFRDNYVIDFVGCINDDIDSKFIPDFACLSYKDTCGNGRPETSLNMKDSNLLDSFANNRHQVLGMKPSEAYLKRVDLCFGIRQPSVSCLQRIDSSCGVARAVQNYNKLAVDASYIWYIGEKAANYEYKLSNGTVILKGKATIKDNCILSYIKHFMRKMSSVDISHYG